MIAEREQAEIEMLDDQAERLREQAEEIEQPHVTAAIESDDLEVMEATVNELPRSGMPRFRLRYAIEVLKGDE